MRCSPRVPKTRPSLSASMASDGRIAIDFVPTKVEVVQYKGGLTRSGEAGQIIEQEIQRDDRPVNKDEQKLATRSLYEQLTANKQAADEAAKTKERDSMLPRGLDEEDIDFLDHILDQQAENEHQAAAQAQADREVFEAQLRTAADRRAAESDIRTRATLLGTAPAALLRGPFHRQQSAASQPQAAEPTRKRPAEQSEGEARSDSARASAGVGADGGASSVSVGGGGAAAQGSAAPAHREQESQQLSSGPAKRVKLDGPAVALPSFASMVGGPGAVPGTSTYRHGPGTAQPIAGAGLVGYGSDSDDD